MQSYISHHARGTVFYHLINYLSSKSCPIDLLRKISEIIENMIFSLIFVLQEIWYFRQLRKTKKIWYLRWAFLRKCCFSCSVNLLRFMKLTIRYFAKVIRTIASFMPAAILGGPLFLKKPSLRLENDNFDASTKISHRIRMVAWKYWHHCKTYCLFFNSSTFFLWFAFILFGCIFWHT